MVERGGVGAGIREGREWQLQVHRWGMSLARLPPPSFVIETPTFPSMVEVAGKASVWGWWVCGRGVVQVLWC